MKKCVYCVAAESGGALNILEQYYNRAVNDTNNEYLFVVSVAELLPTETVKVQRYPKVKRDWFHRLFFDLFRAHRIVNLYSPDEVLSLQNTIVPFAKASQAVYMHNPLPKKICDCSFSILKSPKLWVYQNIIGRLIIHSCKRADHVIVQTKWMAKRLIERCGIDASKISIESITIPDVLVQTKRRQRIEDKAIFLYPASASAYKNHAVIIEACKLLIASGYSNFQIKLTITGEETNELKRLKRSCIEQNLPVIFAGWLNQDDLSRSYETATCLLFPSKLETWGLPLSEAQVYALPIIAADLEYAYETLDSYNNASFFPPDNAMALANLMKAYIDRHN